MHGRLPRNTLFLQLLETTAELRVRKTLPGRLSVPEDRLEFVELRLQLPASRVTHPIEEHDPIEMVCFMLHNTAGQIIELILEALAVKIKGIHDNLFGLLQDIL